MTTYGRPKKKSLLASFSVLRDSDSTPDSFRSRSSKQDSSSRRLFSSRHNDSIEEMASMLLDDSSIDQAKAQPAMGSIPKPTVKASAPASEHENPSRSLPPSALVNGDPQREVPSGTLTISGSSSMALQVSNEGVQDHGRGKLVGSQAAKHLRRTSAPLIPRRSSKRMSTRSPEMVSVGQASVRDPEALQTRELDKTSAKQALPKILTLPQSSIISISKGTKTPSQASCINTGEAKPYGLLVDPYKQQLMDSNVVKKVRSVIKDHLLVRPSRKLHDSVRDDCLLSSSVAADEWLDEDPSTPSSNLSAIEIRSNDSHNLKPQKIFNLSGHDLVRRKPVADEKHSKYGDKRVAAVSTTMSSPITIWTWPRLQPRDEYDASGDDGLGSFHDLPVRPRIWKDKVGRRQKINTSPARYEVDFSSSPFAQSTPRIRLEPALEQQGRTTLKNVPSDSRSLFDLERTSSEQELNTELPNVGFEIKDLTVEGVKRKSSQLKECNTTANKHHSKRVKKHSSPSKAELERFGTALRLYPHYPGSGSIETSDKLASIKTRNKAHSRQTLTSKDVNPKVSAAKADPRGYQRGLEASTKQRLFKGIELVTDTMKGSKAAPKSMILRKTKLSNSKEELETQERRLYVVKPDQIEDSLMDIDELQWEQTTYNIGMRRV